MPIYAYKCESCGHSKDVLQKISDAPLKDCPACGQSAFAKQVTAAGFQLKGSGWYVTDFRGGNASAPASAGTDTANADAKPGGKSEGGTGGGSAAGEAAGGSAAKTETATASAAASSAGCGGSCACH